MGRPDWDWSRVHWDNMDASIDSIGRFIRDAQDRTNEVAREDVPTSVLETLQDIGSALTEMHLVLNMLYQHVRDERRPT